MISYLFVLRKGALVHQHGERNAEHYPEEKLTRGRLKCVFWVPACPLFTICHMHLFTVVSRCKASLVNKLFMKKKSTDSPSVKHYKFVFRIHIGKDIRDVVILPIHAKCYDVFHPRFVNAKYRSSIIPILLCLSQTPRTPHNNV